MNAQSPSSSRAEFIIVIRVGATRSGLEIVNAALAEALENQWEEGATAVEFVREQFRRVTEPQDAVTGKFLGPTLYGFQIELPEEVDRPAIIKDVHKVLLDDPDVKHIIKFYDTLVEEKNIELMRELFGLEMRLRYAISLVYLHVYAYGGFYYDLLRNDTLGTDGHLRKRMPKPEELRGQAENEFFHLLFNHYGELNVLRKTRQVDDLVKQITISHDFPALQRELQRMPVENEDDRRFLDRINQNLNSVENLRNCVMHNRALTQEQIDSYETARNELNDAMDELFERWAITPDSEALWDTVTREADEN